MPQVQNAEAVSPVAYGPDLPTQASAWMTARARVPFPGTAHTLAVDTGGGGRALALLRRTRFGLREMPLMDAPSDVAFTDEGALAALAERLAAEGQPFFFERLPATSPTLAALRAATRGRFRLLTVPAAPTPQIDTAGKSVAELVGAERLNGLERAGRRLARRGTVASELRAPRSRRDLDTLISEAFDVETRSRKHDFATALTSPTETSFAAAFRGFLESAHGEGHLRFAFLRVDGTAVAMQIASAWGNRYWIHRSAWDKAHAEALPGDLLHLHALRQVAGQGLAAYVFLGGHDPAASTWSGAGRENLMVFGLPHGWRGAARLGHVAGWIARDRLRQRLLAWNDAAETGRVRLPRRADALAAAIVRAVRRIG